jgi:FkbM family methyltransferase
MSVRSLAGTLRQRATDALSARRSAHPATTRSEDGAEQRGAEAAEAMQRAIARDQADFQNMRRLLAFCLGSDSNCIDIGAHQGAVLAEMQRISPGGHHMAFEPLPHLAELLRAQFPQVDVRQSAVSDRAGESDFAYVHGAAEGWSGLLFRPLPTGEQAPVEQIKVRLDRLDDLLDPEYRPAVIKVDVEGAELQVFKGALQTLRRHKPIVIFEHGSGSAEVYGTLPRDVFTFLRDEAGMRIFDLDGGGPYSIGEFEESFFSGTRVNFVAHA